MTSEPTTGEIVRAFRGAGVYGITTALELRIIDRLESQERTIAELTARAESAERERDELVDLIPHTCNTCYFQSKNLLNEEPCVSCRIYSKWTWRGLPQEGEVL